MSKVTKKPKVCKAAESVAEIVKNTQLQLAHHFPCPIYVIERPDFLKSVNIVSEEALEVQRKKRDLNEIYPVYMTGNYLGDSRMAGFSEFVLLLGTSLMNKVMPCKIKRFSSQKCGHKNTTNTLQWTHTFTGLDHKL